MKNQHYLFTTVLLIMVSLAYSGIAQKTSELPLWPNGIPDNPIKYKQEKVRTPDVNESSLSLMNRVFSCVSSPTYVIHQADKGKANGVGIVICPGGGFRDVWFDREGNDFALWLAKKGITSLVLKYRTYNADEDGFTLDRGAYYPEVYADARQAINILREKAEDLGLDKNKIGIGGFSAGGALSLMAALDLFEDDLPDYAQFSQDTHPDFTCLVYPGIRDNFYGAIAKNNNIPPMFMVNGREDNKTPASRCVKLYEVLADKNVPAELHIYSKGNHGFDSGIGRGYGVSTWRDSFIAWLKDQNLVVD